MQVVFRTPICAVAKHINLKRGASSSSSEILPPRLLIVYHSRTGLARQMAEAMEMGALAASVEMDSPLNLCRIRAMDATVDDVVQADGYLFCCPENLASASGEMLEFFHRSYYHAFDDDERSMLTGRPYAFAIAAGSDGSNAARQVERICRGWRLRPVEDTFINQNGLPQVKASILLPKVCQSYAQEKCKQLGGLVAATLLL